MTRKWFWYHKNQSGEAVNLCICLLAVKAMHSVKTWNKICSELESRPSLNDALFAVLLPINFRMGR